MDGLSVVYHQLVVQYGNLLVRVCQRLLLYDLRYLELMPEMGQALHVHCRFCFVFKRQHQRELLYLVVLKVPNLLLGVLLVGADHHVVVLLQIQQALVVDDWSVRLYVRHEVFYRAHRGHVTHRDIDWRPDVQRLRDRHCLVLHDAVHCALNFLQRLRANAINVNVGLRYWSENKI